MKTLTPHLLSDAINLAPIFLCLWVSSIALLTARREGWTLSKSPPTLFFPSFHPSCIRLIVNGHSAVPMPTCKGPGLVTDNSTAVCKHRNRWRNIWYDWPCIYWHSSQRSGDRWCHTWDRLHHRQRPTVLGTPPPRPPRAAVGGQWDRGQALVGSLRVSCGI